MSYTYGQEVVSTFDFNQFQPGESLDQCGPASVALMHYAGKPGSKPSGSPQQAIKMMAQLYMQFIGPNTPSDTQGTTNDLLYTMIKYVGNHYQNLWPDGKINGRDLDQFTLKETIRQWILLGYPVIIGCSEDTVFDRGLGKKPYDWDTTNLYHIISITGVSEDKTCFLVRDTANVVVPGPREYMLQGLVLTSATVVVPGSPMWLARPVSEFPNDMPKNTTPTDLYQFNQEEIDTWNMSQLSPIPTMQSGIGQSWSRAWRNYPHHVFGPPDSKEITVQGTSTGNFYIIQQFAMARCEWIDGVGYWYDGRGLIGRF